MEVEVVVSVVTQKLTDLLNEESVTHNKEMMHQLKGIQKSLLQCFSTKDDSDTSRWAQEYLRVLYDMEDEIEKFTFNIARQRKRFGFLMKRTLFFNNFNSCRKLRCKLKKIQSRIERINPTDPSVVEDTPYSTTTLSIRSSFGNEQWSQRNTLRSISDASDADSIKEEEQEDEVDDDDETEGDAEILTNALTKQSGSAIWPIAETQTENPNSGILIRSLSATPFPLERVPQRKKLTFSYSYNEEEMCFVGFKEERLQYPKQMFSFSYQEEELGIFGFQDDVDTLMKRLTEKGERFIPIVGEEGSGKTTLARAIYRNKKIKHQFEFCVWVSVFKEYTAGDILVSLSKSVDSLKEKGDIYPDQQALKARLFEHLKEKRYLIVLDGVGSCGVLEDLKDAFPDEKIGSKIIFTSCEKDWARTEMSLLPHNLNPLTDEYSWNMFLKKAGKEKADAQVPEKCKQRILDICNGLPLKIILIAGLLSIKKTKKWSSVLSLEESSDDVLSLCDNDLTGHSKVCLLYLVHFPKEYDIPVRRLLRLWLAEGFVKRRSTKIFPEDLVQKYFEDLVDRNMIQITKLRSDNSPRRCRLLSVLHDYLLPKAQDISLFYIHCNLEDSEDGAGPFGVRRMVQYAGAKGVFTKSRRENKQLERARGENVAPFSFLSSLSSFFSSGKQTEYGRLENSTPSSLLSDIQQTQSKRFAVNPSLLRSYLLFNSQKKDMPAKEVGIFLGKIIGSRFGLLRVLDLEGVCKPSLPENLGALYHLRYLGLRWTFLDSLPKSVGDLPYLETLDVKHTGIDSLPDSIWKLKHLRHLNLNDIRLAKPPSSSQTLLTLWGLFIDEQISVRDGLDKLLHLRELGISFHLSSSQDVLIDWIAKLTDLQSLRLQSLDDMWHPSKLVLKPLPTLGKLSHLNLLGNLERLPYPDEFPPTLKVLTLSISMLTKDPMQTLGQLPCLTVLRLLADSFLGKKMVCSSGGFSKLRVLKLWMLKEFEEWDVEEEAMQSLKELDIRSCLKLNSIPTRLLEPRCLEELILTNMPDEFIAHVKGIKSQDTSLTVNHLEFTP